LSFVTFYETSAIWFLILNERELATDNLVQKIGTLDVSQSKAASMQHTGRNRNSIKLADIRCIRINSPAVLKDEILFDDVLLPSLQIVVNLVEGLLGAQHTRNICVDICDERLPFCF
jgi:hypothetical protein